MKSPLNIHIYITPFCPVPCHHCYYEALKPGSQYSGLLTNDETVAVLRALDEEYDIDVHLEGGEAFTSENLENLLVSLPANIWKRITLTTSGTVFPKFNFQLLRLVGDLRVSVEGINDRQNVSLRGVSLSRTEAFMNNLQQKQVNFSMRATLFSENVLHFSPFARYAYHHGASKLAFYELQSVGRAAQSGSGGMLSDIVFNKFLSSLDSSSQKEVPLKCVFQFPRRRVQSICNHAAVLEKAGWRITSLPDTPSLTVNANGDMGISPWRIVASRVNDRFGSIRDTAWTLGVRRLYDEGGLSDDSPSTSRIRISSE